MTKEEIIDNIARLNSETWRDREEVRTEIGKLLVKLKKALERQSIAEERYQDLVEYFGDKDIAKCVLEDREEFKKWLERVRWHTKKVDELARKLEQQPSENCEYNRGYRDGYDKGNLNGYELRKSEEKKSEDCVSRQAVIEALNHHWLSGSCSRRIIDEQIDKVKALPPVTPTIPKGATNGDMIKAMFPNLEIEIEGNNITCWIDEHKWLGFDYVWWNAPYEEKRGDEE